MCYRYAWCFAPDYKSLRDQCEKTAGRVLSTNKSIRQIITILFVNSRIVNWVRGPSKSVLVRNNAKRYWLHLYSYTRCRQLRTSLPQLLSRPSHYYQLQRLSRYTACPPGSDCRREFQKVPRMRNDVGCICRKCHSNGSLLPSDQPRARNQVAVKRLKPRLAVPGCLTAAAMLSIRYFIWLVLDYSSLRLNTLIVN